ncbi:TonB-dependent receptor [Neolewinella persica]|uniref:TonB-dependent receptor n=1 Tax=Neolewinella persica TaxID=70998 RepID=UPI00036BAB2A|nr:TonB-dependent receptor [Neolewinella persica]
MNKLILLLLTLAAIPLGAQTTISGYFTDEASGEPLLSANVIDLNTGEGALSNTYGFYSLTLPKADSARLRFSYIGYQSREITVALRGDRKIDVQMSPSVDLQVVEVTSDRGERIEQQTQMSRTEIPVAQIKRIPALLGEVDVLKTLQLLPGVQSGGEGTTGLYVRGGSPDQNLVLLDGVPIYNVSHLLGIFSVFNADALRNVTLTKGGFPARYGGRLSSVLEINMKEGNLNKWEGEGSVGLISSKLTVSGPIKKGKTSVLLSGRRTYADFIAKPLIKSAASQDGSEVDLSLYFYDLNAKLQHKVNDKHRLFLSFYSGADVFGTEIKEDDDTFGGGTDWGNIITAGRWNWEISPKLFMNTTATLSRYEINIDALADDGVDDFRARYVSGIYDFGGKVDLDYIPSPDHYVRFGGGWTNHTYRPGAVSLKAESDGEVDLDTLVGSQTDYSNEFYAYAEDDFRLGALKVNAGLHFSAFSVNDELYTSLQPRLGLRYLVKEDISFKASFSTMQQYINLLTSEALSLPTDLWVPSTNRVRPQSSWQVAAGAAKTFGGDQFEISLEAYYKQMKNVVSFREGASFILGLEDAWEDKVTQGDGEAYGLELFIQKKQGRFTGWLGYTLSWNWRQFDEINSGERFPFRYDRRHDLSIVGNYNLSDRVWVSGAFVYGTGNAVSLPTFGYQTAQRNDGSGFTSSFVEAGVEKNGFRMSNYHRLDLSISFRKKKRKWERTWVIGAYNAYWHRNPYFLTAGNFTTCDDNTGQCTTKRRVREISILPIIPSVSYQFKF